MTSLFPLRDPSFLRDSPGAFKTLAYAEGETHTGVEKVSFPFCFEVPTGKRSRRGRQDDSMDKVDGSTHGSCSSRRSCRSVDRSIDHCTSQTKNVSKLHGLSFHFNPLPSLFHSSRQCSSSPFSYLKRKFVEFMVCLPLCALSLIRDLLVAILSVKND